MDFTSKRAAICVAVASILISGAQGVVVGQIDDFEDGTLQGWAVSLLGNPHPAPPQNVATGGPQGADDNYMLLTSIGGSTAGSRMTVLNPAQWGGDYVGAGVTQVRLWAANFGNTDIYLRLMLEDAAGGPPSNVAVSSNAAILAAGSGWQEVMLGTTSSDLTAVLGSVDTVLQGTTILRLFHGPTATFPGEPSVALMGVDDIQAVPEPATMAALGLGAAALIRKGRKA